MKITRIRAENHKRLVAVDINPDGQHVTLVKGRNAQGKTSVIEAVFGCLLGDKVYAEEPLRDGAEKGWVELTVSDANADRYTIKMRRWKGRSGEVEHELIVTEKTESGEANIKAPVSFLKTLLTQNTIDPTRVIKTRSTEERAKLLADAAGIEEERLNRLNGVIAGAKKTYETTHRDAERAAHVASAYREERAEQPAVSADSIRQQTNDVAAQITRRLNAQRAADQATNSEASAKQQIEEETRKYQERIEALKKRLDEAHATASQYRSVLDTMPSYEALTAQQSALNKTLAETETANARVGTIKKAIREADETNAAFLAAQSKLETARAEYRRTVNDALARRGITAMSTDDDGALLINGRPAADASGAERFIAAIQLSAANNPKVRYICYDDADTLDPDSLKKVHDFCEKNDYGILMTGVWCQDPQAYTVNIDDGKTEALPVVEKKQGAFEL